MNFNKHLTPGFCYCFRLGVQRSIAAVRIELLWINISNQFLKTTI
jgi:hypothetical protein